MKKGKSNRPEKQILNVSEKPPANSSNSELKENKLGEILTNSTDEILDNNLNGKDIGDLKNNVTAKTRRRKNVNKNNIELGNENITSNLKLDENLQKEIKDLLQDELKNAVQEVKKDFLVIFGLFASFVTFLSINVQVFKNNDNIFELIGLCSMTLSFILLFTLIINGIVKNQEKWSDLKKPTYVINFIFLVIGIVFLLIGSSTTTVSLKRFEKQSITDSLNMKSLESKIKELNTKNLKLDSTIIIIQNSFNDKKHNPPN